MSYGTIPDEIVIVSSVEQPVYRRWDDVPDNDDDEEGSSGLKAEKEMVTPAFVCDAGNPKTLATAVSWAERSRNYYDYEKKKSIKKADPVVQDRRKNEPMKDIRVVSLDIRGNGGRAYKVVTKDNYYFDLREDVLLDAMIKAGIREGGYLNGEYIWARVSSQMKLVRVGSTLHAALIKTTEKSKLKRIGVKELVHGGVYANKRGEKFVYVGRGNAVDFDYKEEYRYSYYGNSNQPPKYTITRRDIKNAYVFVSASTYRSKEPYDQVYEKHKKEMYYTYISSSHSFIELIDTLPSFDWKSEMKDIRDLAIKKSRGGSRQLYDECYHSVKATLLPADEDFSLSPAYEAIAKQATLKSKTKAA